MNLENIGAYLDFDHIVRAGEYSINFNIPRHRFMIKKAKTIKLDATHIKTKLNSFFDELKAKTIELNEPSYELLFDFPLIPNCIDLKISFPNELSNEDIKKYIEAMESIKEKNISEPLHKCIDEMIIKLNDIMSNSLITVETKINELSDNITGSTESTVLDNSDTNPIQTQSIGETFEKVSEQISQLNISDIVDNLKDLALHINDLVKHINSIDIESFRDDIILLMKRIKEYSSSDPVDYFELIIDSSIKLVNKINDHIIANQTNINYVQANIRNIQDDIRNIGLDIAKLKENMPNVVNIKCDCLPSFTDFFKNIQNKYFKK
jgi:hypothetical protein